MEKARLAVAAGDMELANKLLSNPRLDIPKLTISSATGRLNKATFAQGKTTETDLTPLTPYWDDHMWKLDIHIPLTIFEAEWIDRDILVSLKKSSKNKDRPTGQLPKNEWWLSFSDWTRASRLFVRYLREVYDHQEFANAIEEHFSYVMKPDKRHEWVTAFRYDIAVRSNVMCHHVAGSVADPSVKRPVFLETAKAKTDSFKDSWIRRHDNREQFFLSI